MTVREYIREHYGDNYTVVGGDALDMSVDHGVYVSEGQGDRYGRILSVVFRPYIKWSDGRYAPDYSGSWGKGYYTMIEVKNED